MEQSYVLFSIIFWAGLLVMQHALAVIQSISVKTAYFRAQ
jgi:hypothetical protein